MNVGPNLSKIASIIADPSRGKMLALLMNLDGLPASELAIIAGVTPQTASSHLGKMLETGLIKLTRQGRHRYYSIASEEVADTLEKLAFLAPSPAVRTTKEATELASIKFGRTCYGHVAGRLGVAIFDSLVEKDFFDKNENELYLKANGEIFFSRLGIEITELKNLRRRFACSCLDWTERKYHLAGALGKSLADLMFEHKWIRRISNSRAIAVTEAGERAFKKTFQVDVIQLKF